MSDAAASILERAARRAMLAPSIHNTQPWTFVLTDDALEIVGDRNRRLDVLDPRGRQLLISCGCALFHARVAVQAAGHEPLVRRLPDDDHPELVARVQVGSPGTFPGSTALDRAIGERRTNRRPFLGDQVPESLLVELQWIARTEGALLVPVLQPDHVAAVAGISAHADEMEMADPGYLAEIRAWTTDDPRRRDGVQLASVPRGGARPERALLTREFDPLGLGWLPAAAAPGKHETLLLLCATVDRPRAWLRTGEALERIWLSLTAAGFSASPLTQAVEVQSAHRMLRRQLGLTALPEILLRVGQAPQAPPSRRRPARDVIVDRRAAPVAAAP